MNDSKLFKAELLKSLGILDWGYTEEARPFTWGHFDDWTKRPENSLLTYLTDHRKDLRQDLRLVYPQFQSALCFLFSYQETKKWMLDQQKYEVGAYTLGFEGEDYHHTLKERLEKILASLRVSFPELEAIKAIDAQPVLERDVAYRAGLGWFGRNSMLIHRKEGSYFIIGTLLLNQKLPVPIQGVETDHCGQCRACVDACPTLAIDYETRTINASKCISTYTIETFKEAPAPNGFQNSRGEIYGCDICQDVCPWNRKPLARTVGELKIKETYTFLREWLFELPKEKLLELIDKETNRGFKRKLFGTPFDRAGRVGWMKNLKALLTGRE